MGKKQEKSARKQREDSYNAKMKYLLKSHEYKMYVHETKKKKIPKKGLRSVKI